MPGKTSVKPPLSPINTNVNSNSLSPTTAEPKGSNDKKSKSSQNSPATSAYRDLLTGDVVEIDQEGNAAVPTQHPTIKTAVPVRHQSQSYNDDQDPLPSGLNAAANFLTNRTRSIYDDDDNDDDDNDDNWTNLSAHVSGFAVASSKHNADFHALFPNVPEDDYLIKSYVCALSHDILIHGRIYISEAHLGFHSNIFGWVTEILVPFSAIVSIEKRNTAYVIPNAIMIATLQHKYLFNGLVTRDLTYSMLVNIWRLSRPSPLPPDMRNVLSRAHLEQNVKERRDSRDSLRNILNIARTALCKTNEGSGETETSESDNDDDTVDDDPEEFPSNPSQVHEPTECACGKNKEHYSAVVLDRVYDATMKQMFDMFYKSDFLLTFLRDNQKLVDVDIGEWTEEKGETPNALATRQISYVKPLSGSIGPKQTRCLITEDEVHIDFNDYCTNIMTTRTPDVPNGGTFCIKTRTCAMWAPGNKTRLLITCQTEWKGRSLLRSVIDKASIDGQKQYYADMNAEVTRIIARMKGASAEEQEQAAAVADEELKEDEASGESKGASVSATVASNNNTLGGWVDSAIKSVSEIRPTVFVLSTLIVVLIISHVWTYVSGPSAYTRDPGNPHRLTRRRGADIVQVPDNSRAASALVETELNSAILALERSRRITERLESDIEELQAIVSGLTP
ncbi:hypothetical protein MCUN1_001851 [Malassezia cuniculi]|uniref:VASt domain-containing protein n=1 Tax=Malassezia cuniculi TaxID=948313 RepID=A0AAF0ER92_9BASI|nr:hypothetical protein MCUN1_001851 [Malassezia cuniculi]